MADLSALRSLFSNRNFAIYISGNSISLIGFWMQRLAISWLTWEITESEFWVGAVAFAELAPLLIVSPISGVWADRVNRKLLTVLCQSIMMLVSFVLFMLMVFDQITIEILFIFALLDGILQGTHQPVRMAIIPNLVARKDIVSASSFTAVVFNVARLLGPALAGVVISLFGTSVAVLCNTISYIPLLLAWVFIKLPATKNLNPGDSFTKGLKQGINYVKDIPALRHIFILQTILACGVRPATLMLAAFVGAIYKGGADELALYTAVLGLGAVIGGMYIALRGKAKGLVQSMLINSLISIIALAFFAWTTQIYVGLLMVFAIGWTITLSSVSSQTMVQNSIDDEIRGRVLSLWTALTRGAVAIGVLTIGFFADFFGLFWTNIIAALLCLIGLIWFWQRSQQMQLYFEK
ncbi:MAG: MFS transporter [Gammaproteobacteria bacterium]|nr:MFS transporter [Gammaproteobacteria bacterium]